MEQNYKVQPFDLDTALTNPEWVYLDDGRKVDEFAHLKIAGLLAVTYGRFTELFFENGDRIGGCYKLVLHVPVKTMKITVFVWANGRTVSYSESECKGFAFDDYCQQAEQGKCTRHEFEVEVNEPQP